MVPFPKTAQPMEPNHTRPEELTHLKQLPHAPLVNIVLGPLQFVYQSSSGVGDRPFTQLKSTGSTVRCFNKIFALGEFFTGTKHISKSSYFYEGGEVVIVWDSLFMLSCFFGLTRQ